MHKEYVIRAANAGKHVWCEKPMAISVAECKAMIDACKKNKRTLAIGYRLQHEPNTQEYTRIVNRKILGKVLKAELWRGLCRKPHQPLEAKQGDGRRSIVRYGCLCNTRGTVWHRHGTCSSNVCKNVNQRPKSIRTGLDETTIATLAFPGGVMADIKTSFGENINYLNIDFEKGEIKVAPYQAYAGVIADSPLGEINHPYQVPWQQAKQMDDDAMSIMQEKPMLVPGEEGFRDIRIVEAIYKSAATGKPVAI